MNRNDSKISKGSTTSQQRPRSSMNTLRSRRWLLARPERNWLALQAYCGKYRFANSTRVSSIAGGWPLVSDTKLPDSDDVAGSDDVNRRVAINQHEVGAEAFSDAAPVIETKRAGRLKGGGGKRLERCETRSDEQLQLTVKAQTMGHPRGWCIGACKYGYARSTQCSDGGHSI